MFEEMTYETIMRSMMEDMPDDIDTSEGSLIFNACAKQAVRLEEAYLILSGIEKNMYADTADLEHIYRLGCDEPGAEPNHITGELDPIEYVENFEWGRSIKCILEGTDQEETESYRARLLATYNYRGFAGNREYYKSRVKELRGVYGCKLERVKTPSDRIAITIIGQDYRTPPQDVITATQTAVDPVVNSGEGEGFAPIGHRVFITGVKETTVNITTTITCESGYTTEALTSYINQAVDEYLLSLRKGWEENDTIIVRILQIEAAIVKIKGIIDVTGTLINGTDDNLQITDKSVPVKGEITCT